MSEGRPSHEKPDRREAETPRVRESLLRKAQEIAHLGSWEYDCINNHIVWSDEVYRIFGLDRESFQATIEAFLERVPPEDRAAAEAAYSDSVRDGRDAYEVVHRVVRADTGEIRHVYGKCEHERDAQGRLVRTVGTVHDITERVQAEEALAESEQRYRMLFEDAPMGIFRTTSTGQPLAVNPAMARMLGFDSTEQTLAHYSDLGSQLYVDASRRDEFIRLLLESGRVEDFEYEARAADGSTIWLSMNARIAERHADGSFVIEGFATDVTQRKRAEMALRESESRFRTVLENLPGGVFAHDLDGRFVVVNEAACRNTGYSREELLGMSVEDVDPESVSREDRLRFWNALHEGESASFEVVHRRKDGSMYPAEVHLNAVKLGDRRCILPIAYDITDRKRAAEALAVSEHQHRTLFENAPEAILVQTEGRVVYLNEACARLFGADSRERLVGQPVLDRFHPGFRDILRERIRVLNEEHQPVGLSEEIVITLAGDPVPVEVSAVPFEYEGRPGALVFIRDIRVRKQAESERERLLSAIEQSREIVVITDPRGNIQYVNPGFEAATGYRRDEVIGGNPRLLKSGNQDEAFYRGLWETISGGETWHGRFINRRKDGALYSEDKTISPVCDAGGHIVNYVAVGRDITRDLQLEEQYRQAQKMEAIGQLTGGVAHDFNNLLQVINGGTDMALSDLPERHPARDILDEVRKAGQRAARLVSQLLLFSRRQIMRPETLDLNRVVDDLLKMLRRVIGEHVRLEWLPASRLPSIRADRGMVEQVLLNLCVNARDAMPEGGRLALATARAELDVAFCELHDGAEPGKYVLLSIADTGQGMDAETLERCFEPFFTTKGTGKGTGLGLPTVYGIVRQHNGLIDCESSPGLGCTFRVYLPISEHTAERAAHVVAEKVEGGAETVLVAEDDEMVRALTRTILERAGYRVLLAGNGREAVEVFSAHEGEIDLVVLDVMMPEMGGREAYERIREIRPGVRALFASGYSEDAIHQNFVLDEGLTLIQKPYLGDALLRAVRAMLDA